MAGGAGRALVRVLLERQEVAATARRHGEGHEEGRPRPYRAAARAEGADGQERGRRAQGDRGAAIVYCSSSSSSGLQQ